MTERTEISKRPIDEDAREESPIFQLPRSPHINRVVIHTTSPESLSAVKVLGPYFGIETDVIAGPGEECIIRGGFCGIVPPGEAYVALSNVHSMNYLGGFVTAVEATSNEE